MSRSLGDSVAKTCGIIYDPEFNVHTISAADRFLILASDGLWDVMGNDEAVQFVGLHLATASSLEQACEALILEARGRWSRSTAIDDISILLVSLSMPPSPTAIGK
jgi:serine/threonine protein phosphatase PrpC